MTLQDIFDQLALGELSNLHIGEEGVIQEKDYKKLLLHINLGLNALYKRFLLKEGTLRLQLVEGVYTYKLQRDFAENYLRSVEDIQYIKDTEDNPFNEDILKVERIYSDSGYEFLINDLGSKYSIRTSSMNTLEVPQDIVDKPDTLPDYLKTDYLEVVYRASHPKIEYSERRFRPERIAIELPYSHVEPLLLFVASRVHNPIGMQENFHAGNSYAAKYERACQALELQNIKIDNDAQTNSRLVRGGWR